MSCYALKLQVSVGTCSTKFFLSSGCVLLDVTGQWYRNGESLDTLRNPLYFVSSSGELRIRTLSNETAGYYVCVTTLGSGQGSYRTVDTNLALDIPGESNTCIAACMEYNEGICCMFTKIQLM